MSRATRITRRGFLRASVGASIGLAVVGTMGLTAACTPQQAASRKEASFTVGTDLRTTDPHADTSRQATVIQRHMFETLLDRDQNLKLIPLLATSWTKLSPNTYELKLRDGVKFHNGQPLTAEDVKFSFDRMTDKELNLHARQGLSTITETSVVDKLTVRMSTSGPDAVFLNRLAHGGSVILPAEAFQKAGADEFAKKPIGSGKFKFVEWVKDDHLTMEANPDYWGGKATLDRLHHKPILEASTRVAALKTGALDLSTGIELQQIQEIEGDSKLSLARVRNHRVFFVGMNVFREPFKDPRVRQALNYGTDVDGIMANLLNGQAVRTPNIVSTDQFGYDADQKPYPYDPERAKKLLADAGFPNGFEVTLNTPKGRYLLDAEIAQAVSGSLAKIGVKVNVEITEYGNFLAKLFDAKNAENRYTMFYIGFGTPILDIDDTLGAYFDSKRRGLYYNDPQLDGMIQRGLAGDTPEARMAVYKEAQNHIREAAPWIFLFQLDDYVGVTKRLQNYELRADEGVWLGNASVTA